jgi:hypothetical protein
MPFMVIYSRSDGTSCHEQADAIDEAALFVERLRNQDAIEEIRIFRMEEISFAFRPYYKVELGMPERLVTIAPPPEVFAPAPAVDEPEVSLDAPEPAAPVPPVDPNIASEPAPVADADGDATGANGRRGLFGR